MAEFNIEYIIRAIDKFSPVIEKLQKDLAKTEAKTQTLNGRIKSLATSSFQTGKALFTRLTIPILGLAAYAIKTATNFEEMKISLEAVTGSAANAAKIFDIIRKQSMITPLAPEALTQAAIKLRNLGVPLKDLPKTLSKFSTLALGSGTDASMLVTKFGKAFLGMNTDLRAVTRISKDLPIAEAIQKVLGLSDKAFASIKKQKGVMISAATMQKAINYLTQQGSSFYDAATKRANSLPAVLKEIHSAMRSYVDDVLESLGGN